MSTRVNIKEAAEMLGYLPVELKDGDFIKMVSWENESTAKVGTARGSAEWRYGDDPEEMHQRELSRGHDTAWALLGPSVLYGDRKLAELKAIERRTQFDTAIELADCQPVIIEGELFTVKINRGNETHPRNSDPVKFVPFDIDTCKLECKFIGGELDGKRLPVFKVRQFASAFTENKTKARKNGGLVQRWELDEQPKVRGYLGPMWNGDSFRYETQAVYNELSK